MRTLSKTLQSNLAVFLYETTLLFLITSLQYVSQLFINEKPNYKSDVSC